jgi:hypothetical protein
MKKAGSKLSYGECSKAIHGDSPSSVAMSINGGAKPGLLRAGYTAMRLLLLTSSITA